MDIIGPLITQFNYSFRYRAYSRAAFFKQLLLFPYRYYVRRRPLPPLSLQLLLTFRCNQGCRMCSFKPLINRAPQEITAAQVKGFIDRNRAYRPSVFLGGGEPFARPDMMEIIAFIKSRGLNCGVCTNGSLLDEAKAGALVRTGLDYVIFSLHGPRAAHVAVTGSESSFDTVMASIGRYMRTKKSTQRGIINCAVTRENIHHLEEVMRIAEAQKADLLIFQHLSYITPRETDEHRRAGCFAEQRIISHFEESRRLPDMAPSLKRLRRAAGKYRTKIIFKPDLDDAGIDQWYRDDFGSTRKCFFLWGATYVYPDGGIYPCQYIEKPLGNILDDNLLDVWYGAEYASFRDRVREKLLPFCSRCCKL